MYENYYHNDHIPMYRQRITKQLAKEIALTVYPGEFYT